MHKNPYVLPYISTSDSQTDTRFIHFYSAECSGKNRNMLIICGIFSIKHHTAPQHESVAVYFAGGKCINIHFFLLYKGLSL